MDTGSNFLNLESLHLQGFEENQWRRPQEPALLRIQASEKQVSHWYYKGQSLLAVDALNDPRCYMIGKRLIEANKSPSKNQLRDENFNLKVLLK